ncbi:MAG: hypothetical protein J7L38_02465 [Thermoproteales archaeon]|nr:hypothetical protein [Thermoproteales archaeon]
MATFRTLDVATSADGCRTFGAGKYPRVRYTESVSTFRACNQVTWVPFNPHINTPKIEGQPGNINFL